MTKLGEVFAVPVRVEYYGRLSLPAEDKYELFAADGFSIADCLSKPQAIALADAINTHDRMREQMEELRSAAKCYIHNEHALTCPILHGLVDSPICTCGHDELAAALAREGEKE